MCTFVAVGVQVHPEDLVRRWTAAEVADFVSGLFGPPSAQALAGALRHSSVDGDVLLAVVFDGTLPDGVETLTFSGVRLESGGPVPVGVVGAIRRTYRPQKVHRCLLGQEVLADVFEDPALLPSDPFTNPRLWPALERGLRAMDADNAPSE